METKEGDTVRSILNGIEYRDPLIIPNSSLPRRRESSYVKNLWIPAFAGMTFLEVAYKVKKIVKRMAVLESQDGKSKIVTEVDALKLFYREKEDVKA